MFKDEFKERYTTIPFAIYKAYRRREAMKVIAHQHKEAEIIAIIEGSAEFYIDSKCHRVTKGDILIIPPYALHRANALDSEITAYYCICFDTDLLCDESLKKGLETRTFSVENFVSHESPYAERFQNYIINAFVACEKNEKGWELDAVGNMSLLFGALKKNDFFVPVAASDTDFAKDVMSYIIENYASALTSRDAANEFFMDHSYFCRLFKKNFGCCFANYILDYRLEKAKIYLSTTDLPVTEIAFRVGFNDCSYFCKTFKKANGISPLSYRKADRH